MGLGGFVLGGALAGIGKGMAETVESNALQRREERLAALRQAERAEDRVYQKEDFAAQQDAIGVRDVRLAGLDEAKDNRRLTNEMKIAAAAADAATEAEKREEQRLYRIERFKTKLEIAKARGLEGIKAAYADNDVEDIIETEGGVTLVRKNGKPQFIPMKLREEAPKAGATTLLGEQGAPKASPTTRPAGSGGGKLTDAQAEAFANNPANKGKSFIGPDGKQYVVQ